MDDRQIISLFFERSEKAIVELSDKYGKLFLHVANNILHNIQYAEECVNDSLLIVWNTIPPNQPESLMNYVCTIVKNSSVNRYNYNHAEKRNSNYTECLDELEEILIDTNGLDDIIKEKELTNHINLFLNELSEVDQIIFVRRFWYLDSYESISKRIGKKEDATRMRMARIKKNLKKYFIEKGIIL